MPLFKHSQQLHIHSSFPRAYHQHDQSAVPDHISHPLQQLHSLNHSDRRPCTPMTLALRSACGVRTRHTYLGQPLGARSGGLLIHANYFHAIDIYEGGDGLRMLKTASLFSTYTAAYMRSEN
ncbi:hypothetical protein FA95DRAFT_1564618 [Auriscalpium vulgare]|uniref:Uncharacterized protein n=1 Tax=Auriscalpium vulgare TaxID=40419 RepID=A0ACB8REW5_9AGAM|nr:hypothetical protein FA95DRAFT_1564618 [Auriscalpium vulgare]